MKNIIISTERLDLKGLAEEHARAVVSLRNDENVFKYFKNPHRITLEEHIGWYRNRYLNDDTRYDFVIMLKDTDKVIGTCGVSDFDTEKLSVEVSYMLDPKYQGYGYAKETVLGIMEYCGKMYGISTFYAVVHKDNKASIKFIKKLEYGKIDTNEEFEIYKLEREF